MSKLLTKILIIIRANANQQLRPYTYSFLFRKLVPNLEVEISVCSPGWASLTILIDMHKHTVLANASLTTKPIIYLPNFPGYKYIYEQKVVTSFLTLHQHKSKNIEATLSLSINFNGNSLAINSNPSLRHPLINGILVLHLP